jgi:hypothetical protein
VTLPLYRIAVRDHPIPWNPGEDVDYLKVDLPYGEALEIAVSAAQRWPHERFTVRLADGPPKRKDIVHAIAEVAKRNGIDVPNPARMNRAELMLVGAYVARATNHGNRAPKVAGLVESDRHGRLVLRMGGAR